MKKTKYILTKKHYDSYFGWKDEETEFSSMQRVAEYIKERSRYLGGVSIVSLRKEVREVVPLPIELAFLIEQNHGARRWVDPPMYGGP